MTTPASARQPCDRCGDFAKLVEYGSHRICPTCVERLGEIERLPPTASNLIGGTGTVLARIGVPATILVVLFNLPITLVVVVWPDLPLIVETFYGATVLCVCQGALLHMAHRAIRNEPVRVAESVTRAWLRSGPLIGTNLIAGLQIALLCLLAIVPGVIRALSLAVAMPIALHEDEARSATRESAQRMKGHRLGTFVAAAVWSIPFIVLLAVNVVMVVLAESAVGMADPELAAVEPVNQVADAIFGIALPISTLPLNALAAVLYAKTVRYRIY